MPTSNVKIVLYSHDTLGLGHMRRNLAIAQSLISANPKTAILMIAGAHEAGAFEMPTGVDCLTLPTLAKDSEGIYQSRTLGVPRHDLLTLRSRTIQTAIEAFAPDVMIVDKVPGGVFGELLPTLEWLRTHQHTRCVLGLREILDEAETVGREWAAGEYETIIHKYYDAIWIYGDRQIYDPASEYNFSQHVIAKTRYTGYLGRLIPAPSSDNNTLLSTLNLTSGKLVLCMVGGGQDGEHVAQAFLHSELPVGTTGVLVTGPYMPSQVRQNLQDQMNQKPQFHMLSFVTEPEQLIGSADCIISMGGYNTVCEILSSGKPALIVPRVKPRTEQLIRAERLAQFGVVDYVHPENLSAQVISNWLANPENSLCKHHHPIDLDGLKRLPSLLHETMHSDTTTRRATFAVPFYSDAAVKRFASV